jgi:hypothetical protein
LLGLSLFVVMAWRTVTIHSTTAEAARERFAAVRASFGTTPPWMTRDGSGRLVRTARPAAVGGATIESLRALAYHAGTGELVQASVPFWLCELKMRAAQLAFRDTGFDLEVIGATAADLRALGPALLLEETNANGDLLLVWTE